MSTSDTFSSAQLPGLNCGICGYRTCDALAGELAGRPELIKRCINLSPARHDAGPETMPGIAAAPFLRSATTERPAWRDSLGREFDFYLEHFPEDPGPREVILPHNPMLTREMEIQPGDLLIGRPLGMSCGCPITHCGMVTEVDRRTGVIVWCVTGPLGAREKGFKDIGYYIAEAYEGLVSDARTDIRIGMRYFFQPRRCMLQWRHSGLVNFINRGADGVQIRVEGLWIG